MNNAPPFPRISIITPSFNQGQFLEQTICSVLDQNYPVLEYIIVDGGSTDNSVEIIKKYEKHLAWWVSEKDKGQSDAINKGIKKVTGEIVNWLNSDDYYMTDTLLHISQQFANPEVSCYCGRSRVFSSVTEKISSGTDVYPGNLAKTIGWARIDQPETFFRKSVWDKIGLLNNDFHYVMDKEWWVRYLFHYGLNGIKKDDKVLVNFRIHDDSKTGSQLPKFTEETNDLFYSLFLASGMGDKQQFPLQGITHRKLTNYGVFDKTLMKKVLNYFFLHAVLEAYAQNNYQKSKLLLEKINTELLFTEEKKELDKIVSRMKMIPPFLKKWYNKISN